MSYDLRCDQFIIIRRGNRRVPKHAEGNKARPWLWPVEAAGSRSRGTRQGAAFGAGIRKPPACGAAKADRRAAGVAKQDKHHRLQGAQACGPVPHIAQAMSGAAEGNKTRPLAPVLGRAGSRSIKKINIAPSNRINPYLYTSQRPLAAA